MWIRERGKSDSHDATDLLPRLWLRLRGLEPPRTRNRGSWRGYEKKFFHSTLSFCPVPFSTRHAYPKHRTRQELFRYLLVHYQARGLHVRGDRSISILKRWKLFLPIMGMRVHPFRDRHTAITESTELLLGTLVRKRSLVHGSHPFRTDSTTDQHSNMDCYPNIHPDAYPNTDRYPNRDRDSNGYLHTESDRDTYSNYTDR